MVSLSLLFAGLLIVIIVVWLRAVSFDEGEISKVCVMSISFVHLADFG